MIKVRFGTGDWAWHYSDEFILGNVKVVSQPIADNIKAHDFEERGVVVAYVAPILFFKGSLAVPKTRLCL